MSARQQLLDQLEIERRRLQAARERERGSKLRERLYREQEAAMMERRRRAWGLTP